jgi:hypothetical protein
MSGDRRPLVVLRLLAAVTALALHARAVGAIEPRFEALAPRPATRDAAVAAPIYNGRATDGFPAVVAVEVFNHDGTGGFCSGSLITPIIVLTAGHCLSFGIAGATVSLFPDGATRVDRDAFAYAVDPRFDLAQIAIADVGVLVIDPPVTDVAPLPLVAAEPRAGVRGTIVGFGDDPQAIGGVKREGTVRLKRCPRAVRRVGILPGQLSDSICWRPRRRGQDTCQGDSGGPLLVGSAVAGITSGGFPSCPGRLSWDTSVAAVRDFIDAAVAEANTLTPPSAP